MDRRVLIKRIAVGLALASVLGVGATYAVLRYSGRPTGAHAPTAPREPERHLTQRGTDTHAAVATPSLWARYRAAWERVQAQVDELKRASQDNARLAIENATLRAKLETSQFECRAQGARRDTASIGSMLARGARSRTARVLAGINYRVPSHLLPQQLYTLGVSYLRGGEDEKAAVLLTHLAELEQGSDFKTPKHWLLTGVAWYRVGNYAESDQFFDRVLAAEAQPESLPFQAQARLWKALVAERTHQKSTAQRWLRELVDHHPHSTEAGWVNAYSRQADALEVAPQVQAPRAPAGAQP